MSSNIKFSIYIKTIIVIILISNFIIVNCQRPLINITTNNNNNNLNTIINNNNNYISEKLPTQKSSWRNGQIITATTTTSIPISFSTDSRSRIDNIERATRIPPFRPGRKPQNGKSNAFNSLRELTRLSNPNFNNNNNYNNNINNNNSLTTSSVSSLTNLSNLQRFQHQSAQIGGVTSIPNGSLLPYNGNSLIGAGILNTHTPQRQQYPLRQQGGYDSMKKGISALKSMLAEQPVPDHDDIIDIDSSSSTNPFLTVRERIKNFGYFQRTDINQSNEIEDILGVKCTFETECAWKWNESLPDSFHAINGANLTEFNISGLFPGPKADSFNDAFGNFLYVRLTNSTPITLTSPLFSNTLDTCKLTLQMHQSFMSQGHISVVIAPLHPLSKPWVPSETLGDNYNNWELKQFEIGRVSRDFRVVLEIDPRALDHYHRAHVAIDNLRMVGCFKESAKNRNCSTTQIKCQTNKQLVCYDLKNICDIDQDCDKNEDELLNCDKIPYGGRCDFETDWCGWQNGSKTMLFWSRHTGPSPTDKTGPEHDHTYQHASNISGYYMLVNMNQHAHDDVSKKNVGFASNAIMNSKIFNPPPSVHGNPESPYRNSCMARFNVNQNGMNPGSINFSVVELRDKENVTTTLWWSMKNRGDFWHRETLILPNITTRYFLQFEARMGMRIYSDVAVDDISLSPECFGINIPESYLDGYDYWNPRLSVKKDPHKDFSTRTFLELSTCGARGIQGPTPKLCETAYKVTNNTLIFNNIKVIDKDNYKGMQKWKVPNEGYYTIIAKGAGGGLGSNGVGSSRGATAISVFELHKNEELYILVGQKGENACIKSFGQKEEGCQSNDSEKMPEYVGYTSKTHMVKNFVIDSAAGGGGGGTYVFLINSANHDAIPLMVAGGGGGLGIGRYLDEDFQHGQGFDIDRMNITGLSHGDGNRTAGPGGGWRARDDAALGPTFGASLLEGGRGGLACYSTPTSKGFHGQGGFGGGGGGCNTGGGGGGFSGGDTFSDATNGEGGTSFINIRRTLRDFNQILQAENTGHGSVIIIPAIEGCGCDYRCLALDEYRSEIKCVCPDKWRLKRDNSTQCEIISDDEPDIGWLVIFLCIISVLLVAALSILIFMLYNRYLRRKAAAQRHKMLQDQDLQLSRLRHNTDDSALTNFNPNYGCDGILNGNVDVKSLPQVARESLRLVKALGQGAFGEVYQGLYRHRDGDAVEMPVAVKTLPEMSTGQAEADFLMEAAIMAKFNHPNIVHLIGVCFDRHPRFIVLELLAGGDLKNFLREGRNKPERPSPLTMKDLVFCALDVAKGCRYMESKRFIHRDIAARNCLLSSKGPGRVVKIADFGMARDIYRSDYYRKGGKAMLPIKWMPPEAFLDGIFTSKTDVWSFGVLLWEVFSLGLMPYTGLPNRDVMQLVTGGGRLDAPTGCPSVIYTIMAECWNPTPEERPSFSNLLERLTSRTQDPEVMNAPLPSIFFRPPSSERDQTIMRPPGNDEFCLQIPNSDYLIPLPAGPRSITERLLSEATGVTLPDTMTTCSAPIITSPSAPKSSLQHQQQHSPDDNNSGGGGGGSWETSFIMPTTNSNENLLENDCNNKSINGIDGIIMNHNHYHHQQQQQQQQQQTYKYSPTSKVGNNGSGNNVLLQKGTSGSPKTQATLLSNGGCNIINDDDTRLISLDTPQPTPTTIKPPITFSQFDGITLDPSALPNGQSTGGICIGGIINNSNNNRPQAYANIQMSTNNLDLHNGTIGGIGGGGGGVGGNSGNNDNLMNGNLYNGSNNLNGSNSTININSTPFTIQGCNERYINKDNHSEISC